MLDHGGPIGAQRAHLLGTRYRARHHAEVVGGGARRGVRRDEIQAPPASHPGRGEHGHRRGEVDRLVRPLGVIDVEVRDGRTKREVLVASLTELAADADAAAAAAGGAGGRARQRPRAMVFVNRIKEIKALQAALKRSGFSAAALHG